MSRTTVDVRELPARFAEVVSLATAGEEVIVTENHVPKARLVPLAPGSGRTAGLHSGAIVAAEDFDAPLPEDFWEGKP